MTETDCLFVGLDDTDNETSIGTGRLARNLAEELGSSGLATPTGVTRHQLLVDSRIPYTSHNSAAAIVLTNAKRPEVLEYCREFLRNNFHPGADPGLCMAGEEAIQLTDFGRLAQREIVDKADATALAARVGCLLEEHGGTGLGIVGALAAVGLRASNNDGRYLDLGRCRLITGVLTVDELICESGAHAVRAADVDLPGTERVNTQGWVRPQLIDGKTVVLVERSGDEWRTSRPNKNKQ